MKLQRVCVWVCVLCLPNEQLGEATLDGTVSVRALADVVDAIDVPLHGLAMGLQVAQVPHDDDVVTVVQGSCVPPQDAVASVPAGQVKVLHGVTHTHNVSFWQAAGQQH